MKLGTVGNGIPVLGTLDSKTGAVKFIKKCSRCGKAKTLGHFPRDRNKQLGRHNYCKPCSRKQQAEYRTVTKQFQQQ
jgi:hypothetical protein